MLSNVLTFPDLIIIISIEFFGNGGICFGKRKRLYIYETENIFPIIKKWLYSDKDIFLREIVSNASDAIQQAEKAS